MCVSVWTGSTCVCQCGQVVHVCVCQCGQVVHVCVSVDR